MKKDEIKQVSSENENINEERKERFVFLKNGPSYLIALVASLTLCVYIPIVAYLRNVNEFSFGLLGLLKVMVPVFILVLVALFIVFQVICTILPNDSIVNARKRGSKIVWAHIFVLLLVICVWVEGSPLSIGLPQLTGDLNLFTSESRLILDSAIWIVIIVVGMLFWRRLAKHTTALSLAILLMLGLAVGDAMLNQDEKVEVSATAIQVLDESTFNKDDNVVVLILDATSTALVMDYLEDNPEAKNELVGFTQFENNLQTASSTHWSLPSMLRGDIYTGGSATEYQSGFKNHERSLPQTFKDAGYDFYMSSTVPFYNASEAENSSHENGNITPVLSFDLYGKMFLSFSPYVFKNDIANTVTSSSVVDMVISETHDKMHGNLAGREDTEEEYHDKLAYSALKHALTEQSNSNPTLHVHHVQGAHLPYVIDSEGFALSDSDSDTLVGLEEQSAWTWNQVMSLIQTMKKAGIYDSSTIAIMGDHGDRGEGLSGRSNPDYTLYASLLIKPAYTESKFSVSDDPTSLMNIPELLKGVHLEGESLASLTSQLPSERSVYYPGEAALMTYSGKDVRTLEVASTQIISQERTPTYLTSGITYSFALNNIDGTSVAVPLMLEGGNIENGWGLQLTNETTRIELATDDAGVYDVSISLEQSRDEFVPYTIKVYDDATSTEKSFAIESKEQVITIPSVNADDSILHLSIEVSRKTNNSLYEITKIFLEKQ